METVLTPHSLYPATNAVAQVIFHCKSCGLLVQKHADIARPYAADGTIFPEMSKALAEHATRLREQAEALAKLEQATAPTKEPEAAAPTMQ